MNKLKNKMKLVDRRREEKEKEINKVVRSLKVYVSALGDDNLNFNFDGIVMAIKTECYCSTHTAKDYAKIALYKVNLKLSDLMPVWRNRETKRFQLIKNRKEFERLI